MKPILRIRLFDEDNDKIAELETTVIKEMYKLLTSCEFHSGTIRATYEDDVFNEASFTNQTQCKILASVFREKPLLDFIYNKEL